MEQAERIQRLIDYLLEEEPQYRFLAAQFPRDPKNQRRLLRSLMNLRFPDKELSASFLRIQDALLQEELREKGTVSIAEMTPASKDPHSFLWQGDMTRLNVDAIVNAANAQMLGCFVPCHGCIDNAIHSAAGLQLREECAEIMRLQGHEEPTGSAKITRAYNLPCKYVIHTVGPIVRGRVTHEEEELLADCYRSCLELAEKNGVTSIAFCCISTGEFHFPNRRAAEIAVESVAAYRKRTGSDINVIFNVFKDVDLKIYMELLNIS